MVGAFFNVSVYKGERRYFEKANGFRCGFVLRDEGILRWLLARGLDAHKPLRNSRVQLLTFAAFHGASGAVAALLERSVSVVGSKFFSLPPAFQIRRENPPGLTVQLEL